MRIEMLRWRELTGQPDTVCKQEIDQPCAQIFRATAAQRLYVRPGVCKISPLSKAVCRGASY